jgi:hypothetical protein
VSVSRKAAAAKRASYFLQSYGMTEDEARRAARGLVISVLSAADDDDRAHGISRVNVGEEAMQELDCAISNAMLVADKYDTLTVFDAVTRSLRIP